MSEQINVGVFGASGKMGSEVVRAVERAEGMELLAGVDADDDRSAVAEADVVVDFTHPDAVMGNLEWALARGIHVVVGTTGFTDQRLAQVRSWCRDQPGIGAVIAANFSIGAVLMMKFAELAAPYYQSVEIVEFHHPNKADAPSGTAGTTARRIAAVRQEHQLGAIPDATVHDDGARGAVIEGIHVHGVRLQGLVAHQEVLFGTTGEALTIRHDSFDRVSFMAGVVESIRYVVNHEGLTVGIEPVLGLE